MGNATRNEKRFALANGYILDRLVFDNTDDDVALELIEVLFRTRHMKVIAGVRTSDDHYEEAVAII